MAFKQNIKYIDRIHIVHKRADGSIVNARTINNGKFHRFLCKLGLRHNSMTQTGLAQIAGVLGGLVSGGPVYIGIGTGTTAAQATDTWLQTAKSVQSASSVTRVSTAFANDTLRLVYTFGSTAGGGSLTGTSQVSEVIAASGTASTAAVAFLRQVYSPVDNCVWSQGDTLTITIDLQQKQGA